VIDFFETITVGWENIGKKKKRKEKRKNFMPEGTFSSTQNKKYIF